jgi:hypothetical protein
MSIVPVPDIRMLPPNVAVPVNVGDAANARPRLAVPMPPTALTLTYALFAAFLILRVLSPVSTYHWWAKVVAGSVELLLFDAIADSALFKSPRNAAPLWLARE